MAAVPLETHCCSLGEQSPNAFAEESSREHFRSPESSHGHGSAANAGLGTIAASSEATGEQQMWQNLSLEKHSLNSVKAATAVPATKCAGRPWLAAEKGTVLRWQRIVAQVWVFDKMVRFLLMHGRQQYDQVFASAPSWLGGPNARAAA